MNLAKSIIAAAAVAVSASAFASPVVNNNVRPVAIGTTFPGETSLQSVLDGRFGAGVVNANTDQSTAGMWGSATGVPATAIPTLVIEQTSGASQQTFGIWFGNDTNFLLEINLLLGAAFGGTPASAAAIQIYDGAIEIWGSSIPASPSTCAQEVNCTFVSDARINPMNFGFFFESGGVKAYSIDSITGGPTRFLAYQGGVTTNWVFAFEDGGDFDFNDMVVKVESIKVPEPGSLALLGAGLLGLAVARRRPGKR